MLIQTPAQIRRCKSLPGCSALQIEVEIERPGVISAIQQTPKFFADDGYCFSRSSSNASVKQIQSEAEMNRLMAPVLERLKKEQWSYCDNLPLDSQIFLGLRDELGNKVE